MAAIPAPAEVEQAEPIVEEQPVVEAVIEESPSQEGEISEPAEETESAVQLKALLKGASKEELAAALEQVDPAVRGELEAEIERRGEQRAQTRKQERDSAKTTRKAAFEPLAEQGKKAEAFLADRLRKAKAGDFDALNADELVQAINDYRNGGVAHISLENERTLREAIDTYLPDLTDKEADALEKPLYQFDRTGEVSHALPKVVELAIERAKTEAFAEGVKKGEQNRQAKVSLAEKLTKLQEIKNQAPGVHVNGKSQSASTRRSAIVEEINAVDPRDPNAQATLDELKKRLNKL